MIVIDASVLVAQRTDNESAGDWARSLVGQAPLLAPQHCFAEATNTLRRQARRGHISEPVADQAHRSLLETRLVLVDYASFAHRIWELRDNVTPHDAWYVAIAEVFEAPLATLDLRLAHAPGTRCEFLTPG